MSSLSILPQRVMYFVLTATLFKNYPKTVQLCETCYKVMCRLPSFLFWVNVLLLARRSFENVGQQIRVLIKNLYVALVSRVFTGSNIKQPFRLYLKCNYVCGHYGVYCYFRLLLVQLRFKYSFTCKKRTISSQWTKLKHRIFIYQRVNISH